MPNYISDLEATVMEWAWKYNLAYNKWRKLDLNMTVNLQDVTFHFEEPVFTNQRRSPLPQTLLVMTSNYTNDTDYPQEVEIRAKRTTFATANVRMKQGLTAEQGISVKMALPDAVVGTFGGSIAVNTTEENSRATSTTWKFHSKIIAAPRKKTVARFEVEQVQQRYDFSTYAVFGGIARVTAMHKKTGEVIKIQEDILRILDVLLPNADKNTPKENIIYLKDGKIKWPCRGEIDFQYGISQSESVE